MPRTMKINLILSTAAMLLPALAGLILWTRLPDSVPVHWNALGEVDGYGSKLFVVLGLPGILLFFHIIIMLTLNAYHKKSWDEGAGGIALTMWLMPIISVLVSAFVYAAALGIPVNETNMAYPIVCIVFFICGFIMWRYPGLKTINFPTKSLATRSFSGLVMMICGVVGIPLSIFGLNYILIPVGILCIVIPVVYHFTRGRYIG